ncbi:MAG: dihydropteroate synthase [Chitinophagaceae bacterium]
MFEDLKNSSKTPITTLNCKGRLLQLDQPKIMAILNVTPDSFYDGNATLNTESFIHKGISLIDEGAEILDIGGQSSRPGSEKISPEEEWKRISPVVEGIIRVRPNAIISVDTFYSKVALNAISMGASMINDISAGNFDPLMIEIMGKMQVPYVMMHMKGTPETMQNEPFYENIIKEIFDFFVMKIASCRKAGIRDLIIDPGFGFGKTILHNYQLLNGLEMFNLLDLPLLIGISRKSTIYKLLGCGPESSLNGTTVLHTIALLKGAGILRVHDVREAKECIKLVEAYKKGAIS